MTSGMTSPPPKRIKLESSPSPRLAHAAGDTNHTEEDVEHCSICLQPLADRTIIPTCSHEFCFECLLVWTDQSRRCPLCSQTIGEYLIHHIRSKYDYQKHYLAPLRTSSTPQARLDVRNNARRQVTRRRQHEWGRRRRMEQEEADELERAIEKRKWVYRHGLYAKHVASNPYTRYRPFPTPAQFAASHDLISRATAFIRRELRVWVGLDVEFLTTFTLSLMKSIDIRSEPAIRLLAEFLDMDAEAGSAERVNAEHFAHELYSYLRSPYRDLSIYDTVVQYDAEEDLPPPTVPVRSRRWRSRSRSISRGRSISCSPSRSLRPRSSPRSPSPNVLSPRSSPRRPRSPRGPIHASPQNQTPSDRSPVSESRPGIDRRSTERASHRDHSQRDLSKDRSGSREPEIYRNCERRRGRLHDADMASEYRNHRDVKGKGPPHEDNAVGASVSLRPHGVIEDRRISSSRAGTDNAIESTSGARTGGPNSLSSSGLSSPPVYADLPATTAHTPELSSVAFGTYSLSPHDPQEIPTSSTNLPDSADATPPPPTSPQTSERRPIRPRVHRNAWMTVQAHLSSGGASSNSRRQLDKTQGTDLLSSSTPPLHGSQNTPTRDESHHPNNELHSASGPPSLLLRLSDPSAFSHSMFTAASREPSSGFVDGHPGHMGAKRMSAPEIMARTRARLARLSHSSATDNHSTVSVPAPLKQLHGAGIMEGKKKADAVELVKDALTQHMPPITASEARRTPRETPPQELDVNLRSIGRPIAAGPSASSSCASLNLRAVLLRRLEDEKQNAVNMSQPESGEPSQGAGSAVSMQLMGRSDDDVVKSEPELTAGRAAERREAELRSQAQLRVRLAMVKRAAPHPLDDGRITSSARDGEESISQERLLRAMLKQRRA